MIITDERILVTSKMMNEAGMVQITDKGVLFGVPDNKGGLSWKPIPELVHPEDFDAIEDYFLKKKHDETKAKNNLT